MKMKKKLGWIGFGNFGKFAIPHLSERIEVWVYDRVDKQTEVESIPGVKWKSLEEVAA